MAIHRFTVNVPNGSDSRTKVTLRLKEATDRELNNLRLPISERKTKVKQAFISLDCCSARGNEEMSIQLEAKASVDVHAAIEIDDNIKKGIATYQLVDERNGKVAGGVLLVCSNTPIKEPAGKTIPAKNPCRIQSAGNIYFAEMDGDPRKPISKILYGEWMMLVAPLTNNSKEIIHDSSVYLEHSGLNPITIKPGIWNIGTFESKTIFYATWPVQIQQGESFNNPLSLVVASRRASPIRLFPGILHRNKQ